MTKLLKTLTKDLGLDENEGNAYFNYIVDSFINGQINQTRKLFGNMKKDDKRDFIRFLKDNHTYESVNGLIDLCIDEILI